MNALHTIEHFLTEYHKDYQLNEFWNEFILNEDLNLNFVNNKVFEY